MNDLDYYQRAFQSLRVNRGGGEPSPHKPCMLLAVIDYFDATPQAENRLSFSPNLLERYRSYFDLAAGERDRPNPYMPFFHLKSEGFWQLKALPNREEALGRVKTATSPKDIRENIDYAYLEEALFEILKNKENRQRLTRVLIDHWFDRTQGEIERMLDKNRQVNQYEMLLRSPESERKVALQRPEYLVRNAAFRRVVLEAYDYRCAATGTRLILPDESVLVEAAHLEEFRIRGNDEPQNGIALSKDIHWVMDRGFIAPGPDYKWHISQQIDKRLPDNQKLIELDGTDIILPKQQSFWPKEAYLKHRLDGLL